jgi:hypothetical protein
MSRQQMMGHPNLPATMMMTMMTMTTEQSG